MRRSILFCLPLILTTSAITLADVKLPAVFSDHMVLQRGQKVPVWGTAEAGEGITVTIGDAKTTATAGDDGKWSLTIDSLKASDQPIDVTVAGKNTVTIHDVLVGDVWLCSGQSNMEFQLSSQGFGGAHNQATEIPKADYPTMRLFVVNRKIAFQPQTNCEGAWTVCTPKTASRFSAVGYFFGKEILADQKVPVGLIGSYWGGTPAESWTSRQALAADPATKSLADRFDALAAWLPQGLKAYPAELTKWKKLDEQWQSEIGKPFAEEMKKWTAAAEQAKAAGQPIPAKPTPAKPAPHRPLPPDQNPGTPTVLYNGMIAPLIPFSIKGVIWYQGEANAGQAMQYRSLFPVMITDWRQRWGQGDFPFCWVQLANFMARTPAPTGWPLGWPGLREAQSMTLKLPNTGQAVIIDIGQADDIHPKDKADVGHRLALAARHIAYGEDVVASGPTYDSMTVEGDKIRVKFKNTDGGLTIAAAPSTQPGVPQAEPASSVQGFSIAGADQKFVWATATIDGDSVVVSNPAVKNPAAVRYAWANNPECNLYNKEHLPASPFRTDTWTPPAPEKH